MNNHESSLFGAQIRYSKRYMNKIFLNNPLGNFQKDSKIGWYGFSITIYWNFFTKNIEWAEKWKFNPNYTTCLKISLYQVRHPPNDRIIVQWKNSENNHNEILPRISQSWLMSKYRDISSQGTTEKTEHFYVTRLSYMNGFVIQEGPCIKYVHI